MTQNDKRPLGIREYGWQVEEALYGNWDVSEREMKIICRRRRNSIRIRYRRRVSPGQAAADLARWHNLKPLARLEARLKANG